MSRLPIRVRMTAAFALATLLVLAAAGAFAFVRLRADLDESIDEQLRARAEAVAARGPVRASEPEEQFERVVAAADAPAGSFERIAPGIEGTARVLVVHDGARAIVVGRSLEDRDETLGALTTSLLIGAPLAVALASLLGYALAGAGLVPVEAMRRRAAAISAARGDERLPLPAAHDEIRRLGETLNAMLERLQRSFESERRFVADASHELRTPVAVIRTELERALRRGDLTRPVREAVGAAADEAERLGQLAEDLLVLARAADDRLPVRREPVDVGALLRDAAERFGARAARHGRPLAVDAPDGLVVEADPLRLRQAIGNLTDNALRHGRGAITLAARRSRGRLEIEVRDEGAGFDAPLFERFARGEGARSGEGTGLGLAIVRAIAEAHGGSADVDGATVRIKF
jgi:signal transduction histidine kinase